MKNFLKSALAVLLCSMVLSLNAAPSPWDSWRSGYTSCEQAERQFERGNYTEALSLFEKSRKHYLDVRSARPDWNQKVIAERIGECERRINEVRRLLGAMKNQKRREVAKTSASTAPRKEFKPGDSVNVEINDNSSSGEVVTDVLDTVAVLELRSTLKRQQKELENNKKMMVALRSKLLETRAELASVKQSREAQRNFEQEIANLMRDRRIDQEKYALLEARCKKLEADSMQPNLQLEALNQRLAEERMNLERERKRAENAETAFQQSERAARDNQLARSAAEKVLNKERQEYAKLLAEMKTLQSRMQENNARLTALRDELERTKKHNAELSEAIKRGAVSQEAAAAEKLAAENERKAVEAARKNAEIARKNALAEKLSAEKLAKEQQAARNAAVAAKDSALAEKNAALAEKDAAVVAKDSALAEKNIAIAEKDAALAERNAAIAEKNAALAERNAALAEKDAALAERNAAIAEKDAALAEKKAAVAEHGAAMVVISDLRKELAGRNSQLASSAQDTARYEQRIAALEAEIKRRQEQIGELKAEFERGRAAITRYMKENESLRQRNTGLEKDVKEIAGRNETLNKRLEARDSADFRNATAAMETCRKLEKDLLTLQNELVVVRNNANASAQQISDYERKLKAAEAELKEVRAREISLIALRDQQNSEIQRLREIEKDAASLKHNFDALSAENRQNRALLAAAKPKENELARVKLRLLELDRLKSTLTREQQLNEELRSGNRRLADEVKSLRGRASELAALRRRLAELEGTRKELEQLKSIQKDYLRLTAIEPELAKLKIRVGELDVQLKERRSQLEQLNSKLSDSIKKRNDLEQQLASTQSALQKQKELEEMIATQSAEIDRLNTMVKRLQAGDAEVMPAEYRRQIADLRRTAASLGPLNDRLTRLQKEYDTLKNQFSERIALLNSRCEAAVEFGKRRSEEIAVLRKLNAELAEMNRTSSAALKNKVDQAQLDRLNAEIAAMNKLYTEVTAERDRLASEIDAIRRGVAAETPAVKITESPEELAGAGMVAERNGNLELALWNYRQALLADENFRPAHLRLGHILYERQDYAGALPHLSSARAGGKFNLELALRTARCHIALNRYGNAKSIIDPLLKSHSNDYQVQLLAGLIENGSGSARAAEERMITAIRLAPGKPEALIEISRLLADSVTDRKGEAVIYYERARAAGSAPIPDLEKKLASLLDNRREMIRFLSGAASEAEISGDHGSAVWYYRKLVEMKPEIYTPRLALALHKSGQSAKARETLEFNKPTRLGMVILTILENESGNESAALRAARQCSGAVLPGDWQALTMELVRLKSLRHPSAAVRILLSEFQKGKVQL